MTDTLDSDAPPITGGSDMRAFIEAVLGEQRGNVVMSTAGGRLPDGKPIVNRPRWFAYPQQIGQMVAFAEERATEDLYLSPIVYGDERDERGRLTRAKSNALSAQCIYMDSDACPPEKFRLTPSIHVQTSATHGHDYWLLAEPIPAERAAEIAHRITTAHKPDGTDPSGWSQSKFLRMPTVNLSYGEPFPVQWSHSGEVYIDLDVEGAYQDVQVALGAAATAAAPQAPSVAQATPGRAPALLTGEALGPLYDRVPASNRRLTDLLEHKPKEGEKGWRSEQRWGLLLELCREGFTDQEAMSLAWHAAAAGKWWADPRGVEGLWLEMVKARNTVELERGVGIPAAERPRANTTLLSLLTDDERRVIADARGWVDQYVAWAATRVPVLNRPLHEINAWTYAATVHAEVATVWKPQGSLPLNFYSVTLAESSSGKSEAARLLKDCVNAVYPYSVLIGTDHSKNALVETMLDREGEVALATSDEADETFRTQRDMSWAQGTQQAWTEMYDGMVPPQNRKGVEQKPNVKSRLVMHMVGTPEAMFSVMDRSMFKSGYMVRHVWALGEHIPVTRETIKMARPWDSQTVDANLMPRHWGDATWRRRARITSGATRAVVFTEEAYARLDDARFALVQALAERNDDDMFNPIGRRMLDYLSKACALVALGAGRTVVNRRDALLGLAAVETWINNALKVTNSIASSQFSRACDEIEVFVASRTGGVADVQQVFQMMRATRPRDVEEYLDSLVKQGKLEIVQTQQGGSRKYKIKGDA